MALAVELVCGRRFDMVHMSFPGINRKDERFLIGKSERCIRWLGNASNAIRKRYPNLADAIQNMRMT